MLERQGAVMNTFWLKTAGLVIVIVGLIILVNIFWQPEEKPEQPQKTFYDKAEEDKQRFLTEPEAVDSREEEPVSEIIPQVSKQSQVAQNKTVTEGVQPAKEPPEPVELYFKELSEVEEIEAERLLNVAVPGRSIGRLPMTGFNLMVDTCRQIIQRWPDSWYAYRAKQLLADMPPRFQKRYGVTEEEVDLSRFAEPRPGTKPFIIKESR